jgi:hypothetical protein
MGYFYRCIIAMWHETVAMPKICIFMGGNGILKDPMAYIHEKAHRRRHFETALCDTTNGRIQYELNVELIG